VEICPLMLKEGKGWQARRDSNPQPMVLETTTLPIELLTYVDPWFLLQKQDE
jgi:hypothetical protein